MRLPVRFAKEYWRKHLPEKGKNRSANSLPMRSGTANQETSCGELCFLFLRKAAARLASAALLVNRP